MSSNIVIERTQTIPADLETELLPAAAQEGFGALERLREDWEAGTNQFSGTGEAFYVARVEDRLVGVCGLNRDPFAQEIKVGRVRRLYVLPEFRRKGVGEGLVRRAIEGGKQYFRLFHVRTLDAQASAFYVALGFTPVFGQESFTHQFDIEGVK